MKIQSTKHIKREMNTFETKTLIKIMLSVMVLSPIISAGGECDCPISLGSSLVAGNNGGPWLSPSGDFAFGFQLLPVNNLNPDLYLLAIWFNRIPEQTIVWTANNGNPVPQGSTIQLTNNGHLTISDPRSNQIWRAQTGNRTASGAAMLDSGNFVLRNGDNQYTWQSFSHPRDTMLPGQKLSINMSLTSRQSESNYSNGGYKLKMQDDGNLVLSNPTVPDYWSTGVRVNPTDSHLILDESGGLYIRQTNESDFPVLKTELGSKQGSYYMARLDYDGVLTIYSRPRIVNYVATTGDELWRSDRTIPEDICRAVVGDKGSGACGYNSYCVMTNNSRPECSCPEGYSFLNPLKTRQGCMPDFPMPACRKSEQWGETYFVELRRTNWPMADYDLQTVADMDACKQSCLDDCFCSAAIYNIKNQCWKKRFPLSNGVQSKEFNTTTALIKAVRFRGENEKGKSCTSRVVILSAFLGTSVFLNFLLFIAIAVAIFLVCHHRLLSLHSPSTSHGIKVYSYKDLDRATGGFKEPLGKGSFGTVFKGVLPFIPRRYAAIKRLDRVERQGEKEFVTEVNAIGQTHHKNLVTLLGYCEEGSHRLLVYEYMSNGSLADHLFGLSRPRWNQRMRIAYGIARGLTYLHEECGTQIIHCDVKPQNILLDEYLNPKISDFGMAKLLLSEQSRAARTHIRGTIGYFAPEWFRKVSITTKVDVYSFGVMLLEIICCMSSVEFGLGDQEEALIDWLYDCYTKRKLEKLVENDEDGLNDMKSVERVVMVGIWCIQEDPSWRPSMRGVSQMLEGVAQVGVPPRPSGFSLS